jgi:hypothetical protein
MPAPILHVGDTVMCTHGAPVQTVPGNARVMVSGMPVATMADNYLVSGCPFVVPVAVPQPCIRVQWLVPAARVMAGGSPVLIQTSTGLCMGAAPQGSPIIASAQTRVLAT